MPRTSTKRRKENKALTVFITGIHGLTKESNFAKFLKRQVKGIKSVSLPRECRNGGYAFVEMIDKKSLGVILAKQFFFYKGRKIVVRKYMQGKDLKEYRNSVNSRRLFVCSVPKAMSDDTFMEIFEEYGTPEEAYIIRNGKDKQSRGFGYVVYETKELAQWVASKKFIDLDHLGYNGKYMKVKMHQQPDKALAQGSSSGSDKASKSNSKKPKAKKTQRNKKSKQSSACNCSILEDEAKFEGKNCSLSSISNKAISLSQKPKKSKDRLEVKAPAVRPRQVSGRTRVDSSISNVLKPALAKSSSAKALSKEEFDSLQKSEDSAKCSIQSASPQENEPVKKQANSLNTTENYGFPSLALPNYTQTMSGFGAIKSDLQGSQLYQYQQFCWQSQIQTLSQLAAKLGLTLPTNFSDFSSAAKLVQFSQFQNAVPSFNQSPMPKNRRGINLYRETHDPDFHSVKPVSRLFYDKRGDSLEGFESRDYRINVGGIKKFLISGHQN